MQAVALAGPSSIPADGHERGSPAYRQLTLAMLFAVT